MMDTHTACRVKPSGNMLAAPERRRLLRSVIHYHRSKRTLMVIIRMAERQREFIVRRQLQWEDFSRMRGACMTCTGMCGSGAKIFGTRTIMAREVMVAHG